MPPEIKSFHSAVKSLWFRLIGVAIFALVFAESLNLSSGKAQGWTFYLTGPEVAFEVVVRLIFVALAGLALGTACTIALAPFLWYFASSRAQLADGATKAAVGLVLIVDSFFGVRILINWSGHLGWRPTFLLTAYYVAAGAAIFIPRARKELVTSLDGLLEEKTTRRAAIATGIGVAALAATEFVIGRTASVAIKAAPVSRPPKTNILLITFDALSAEDMSLYGYRLPTTPNIDAFARNATVFTSFFSASTFTTPAVATMLTGLYSSDNRVFQLQGRFGDDAKAGRNLPHLMRAAGYATGASIANPSAYYLAESLGTDYDVLPKPPYYPGDFVQFIWNATEPLHQRSPIGSRTEEYWDLTNTWNIVPDQLEKRYPRRFGRRKSPFPPAASFEQAREILTQLPDGFFLWVHAMAPHWPYLPDSADRGRFLASDEMRTGQQQVQFPWNPHYGPDIQSTVDKARLRYDEFILNSDRAFGKFMSELESSEKLRNTAVIVSADHGESFEGGSYTHDNADQMRSCIHIPLIVRTPDQQQARRVAFTADQTALAPTVLDLAGQPKPEWMSGQSLVPWLNRDGEGEGEGLAFTQFFETNSVFAPLRHGTVGVIDGHDQYLVNIATGKGSLRPLNEAQMWNLDRSTEHPELAGKLRAAIYSRFPDLPGKTA